MTHFALAIFNLLVAFQLFFIVVWNDLTFGEACFAWTIICLNLLAFFANVYYVLNPVN